MSLLDRAASVRAGGNASRAPGEVEHSATERPPTGLLGRSRFIRDNRARRPEPVTGLRDERVPDRSSAQHREADQRPEQQFTSITQEELDRLASLRRRRAEQKVRSILGRQARAPSRVPVTWQAAGVDPPRQNTAAIDQSELDRTLGQDSSEVATAEGMPPDDVASEGRADTRGAETDNRSCCQSSTAAHDGSTPDPETTTAAPRGLIPPEAGDTAILTADALFSDLAAPIYVVDALCASIGLERTAVLIPDATGETLVPISISGLSAESARRLRIPRSFATDVVPPGSGPRRTDPSLLADLRPFFGSRDFATISTILLVPVGTDSLDAVLMFADTWLAESQVAESLERTDALIGRTVARCSVALKGRRTIVRQSRFGDIEQASDVVSRAIAAGRRILALSLDGELQALTARAATAYLPTIRQILGAIVARATADVGAVTWLPDGRLAIAVATDDVELFAFHIQHLLGTLLYAHRAPSLLDAADHSPEPLDLDAQVLVAEEFAALVADRG